MNISRRFKKDNTLGENSNVKMEYYSLRLEYITLQVFIIRQVYRTISQKSAFLLSKVRIDAITLPENDFHESM